MATNDHKDTFFDRLKHSWDVFKNGTPETTYSDSNFTYSYQPDRKRYMFTNERTITSAIYTRIAIDVASIPIKHARVDQNGRYLEEINSGLNFCLNVSANPNQRGDELITDIVLSMFDEGSVAVFPVEANINPTNTSSFTVEALEVGKILEYGTDKIKVKFFDYTRNEYVERVVPKKMTAIITNPFYSVMNEPNSTLKRLIKKLSILDQLDERNAGGKLDLIIQLPYSLKNDTKKAEADLRLKSIEEQLSNSKHGIAYTDGTERITQLNRPVDNNLLPQIEYLTKLLYNQLGVTQEVFDGTANEQQMVNYYNRTIAPILDVITKEFKRKFLTKTAMTQGQTIMYIRDPFKLMTAEELAEIADKFTRNEIMVSNEIRSLVGLEPRPEPAANELRNKNLRQPDGTGTPPSPEPVPDENL